MSKYMTKFDKNYQNRSITVEASSTVFISY
jgi:hypothetical protein